MIKKYNINIISFLIFIIGLIIVVYKTNEEQISLKFNINTSEDRYIYEVIQDEKMPKSKKVQKLEALQQKNSDIVALIEIENTNINYPVVQTDNNSYYMMYDYKKEHSKDGAIMLDKACDLFKPTTNILIYGHNNIGSRGMFADLIKYKNKDFYENHKTIKFTTNTEESTYEIICVFLSKVYYKAQNDVFKYYFFIHAKDKEEFDAFINNCKRLGLYEINGTAEYGDLLMTLSTCEYSRPNGRLVVIAKKIK